MSKRVLCLLGEGFEEIETVTPIDLLRRAGAEVIVASLTGKEWVTGRSQLVLRADVLFEMVASRDFDLLMLPGGPGVAALRKDGRAASLASDYFKRGKPVAAICAAPTILKDAGVLEGKRFTSHFSVQDELPTTLLAERTVEDGSLITSRGAGTAIDFGLAMVTRLFGGEKSDEVARAIMV